MACKVAATGRAQEQDPAGNERAAQNRAGLVNSSGSREAAITRWPSEKNSGIREADPRAVAAQSSHRARPVDALYASRPSPPNATAIAIITLAPSSVRLIALPRPL